MFVILLVNIAMEQIVASLFRSDLIATVVARKTLVVLDTPLLPLELHLHQEIRPKLHVFVMLGTVGQIMRRLVCSVLWVTTRRALGTAIVPPVQLVNICLQLVMIQA